MRPQSNPCPGRLRGEGGFTLIEYLVSISMMIVLLGAILPTLFSSTREQVSQADRVSSLDSDRDALNAMTHELRGAYSFSSATGQVLNFQIWNPSNPAGAPHSIRYDCSQPGSVAGQLKCVRYDLTSGTSRTMIDGLLNSTSPAPFAYTAASSSGGVVGRPQIQIELQTEPANASHPVVLRDAATVRTG